MSDLKCIITREGHSGHWTEYLERPVGHTPAVRAACEWTSVSHFSLWLEMQQDPNCTCHTLRGNLLGALKDVWRTGSI